MTTHQKKLKIKIGDDFFFFFSIKEIGD